MAVFFCAVQFLTQTNSTKSYLTQEDAQKLSCSISYCVRLCSGIEESSNWKLHLRLKNFFPTTRHLLNRQVTLRLIKSIKLKAFKNRTTGFMIYATQATPATKARLRKKNRMRKRLPRLSPRVGREADVCVKPRDLKFKSMLKKRNADAEQNISPKAIPNGHLRRQVSATAQSSRTALQGRMFWNPTDSYRSLPKSGRSLSISIVFESKRFPLALASRLAKCTSGSMIKDEKQVRRPTSTEVPCLCLFLGFCI